MWRLGPRRGSLDKNGNLLPVESAARPIVNAIGAFILLSKTDIYTVICYIYRADCKQIYTGPNTQTILNRWYVTNN